MTTPYLSVCVPAYNEADNLESVVGGVVAHLSGGRPFEVVIVDDGSRDRTPEVTAALSRAHPMVRVVRHLANKGYGAALRSGFAAAAGEAVCLYPGDGQFDIREVDGLLACLAGADIVAGYRMKRQDHFLRKVNEFLYNSLIRVLFGLKVRDVDCGFKVYRLEVLRAIPLESDGALIDAELLVKAGRRGYRIAQRGVSHLPRTAGSPTGANLRVILRMFVELGRFYVRIRAGEPGRDGGKTGSSGA